MAARRRPSRSPRTVALASDLGTVYAAQMRAVLLASAPGVTLVDLTHDLRPHAVAEAAFVLAPTVARFPAGAVHVVVVDPGVGGRRAAVAVACRDGSTLVGPDNGVLAPLAAVRGGGRAYRIEPDKLRAPARVGTTFDGRDVFAPAAAYLALGGAPSSLGRPVTLRPLDRPGPARTPGGANGTVAHIDRFGNAVTDVPSGWVPAGSSDAHVRLGRRTLRVPYRTSYEAAGRGRLFLLGSSFGTLELAVGEGRAADRLRLRVGAAIRFRWGGPQRGRPRPNGK